MTSDKLTPKYDKWFFVGYPKETKGYYFYKRDDDNVFVARNGVFLEKEFLSKGVSGSKVQLEEIREASKNVSTPTEPLQEEQNVVEPVDEASAPRRSKRPRQLPIRYGHDVLLLNNDESNTYSIIKHHAHTLQAFDVAF